MDPFLTIFATIIFLLGIAILRIRKVSDPQLNTFSIIVACRNEEKDLARLLQSLKNLQYQRDRYEIILIDDASTDNTFPLLEEFCAIEQNRFVLRITEKSLEYMGKKAALKLGAGISNHNFLLFTDADCIVKPDWLDSYNNYINEQTGMVIGAVKNITYNRFRSFVDNMKFAQFSATTGTGYPFSASGGNLLVRRSTFQEVGGYDSIKNVKSGDDKLLLNLVKGTDWQVRYNPDSIVLTERKLSKTQQSEQQKRHYSKFSMSSAGYQIISLLIFAFYIYLPIYLLVKPDVLSLLIYYTAALFFWAANLKLHSLRFHLVDLIFLVIYPYFLISVSVRGTFSKWKWKE